MHLPSSCCIERVFTDRTMSFELFLALRYLMSKRNNAFISIITLISVLGIMVGVMALVVVLSVMNGFRGDMMSKILGVNSEMLVLNFAGPFSHYSEISKKINRIQGVIASSPFIYAQVMINSSGNVSGAVLRGVDPETVPNVLNIKGMIRNGKLSSLAYSANRKFPPVILGRELSKQIGAYVGDTVKIVAPEGKLTPIGRAPNTRLFRVVGLFDSGMYDYDASMLYTNLKDSQKLLGMGNRVTGIAIKVDDIYNTGHIAKKINEVLGYPFTVKDWKTMNRSLFSALKLEKITMFVILTMIVLVGALNIISTLVMVVMEKTKDVAILRAMGASGKTIMSIFMLQGLLVGFVGTLLGLVSGLGICQLLKKYKFINLPADVYYISTLPVQVQWTDISIVAVSAIVISFLATLYPSRYASKLNPVEAFRYE